MTTPQEIVEQLVETRINGNSIKGNSTYEKMLKRVTKHAINYYSCSVVGYGFDTGLSKLKMIEEIRNTIENSQREA